MKSEHRKIIRKHQKAAKEIFAGGWPSRLSSLYLTSFSKNGKLFDKNKKPVVDLDNLAGGRIFSAEDKPYAKDLKKYYKKSLNYCYSPELELEYGEQALKHLYQHDRLRLTSSEEEALRLAARISCSYTERSSVIFLGGHVPLRGAGDLWIPLTANNLSDAMRLLQQSENKIAAVIINPVLCDDHDITEAGEKLKEFVSEVYSDGALLIMNERYTGFRLSARGFASRFYIQVDMSVYAGIPCGGLPGAILTGTADVMRSLDKNPELHSDIQYMHPLTIMHGLAVIKNYDKLNVQPHFIHLGAVLQMGIEKEITHSLPNLAYEIQIINLQSIVRIIFLDDAQKIEKRSNKLHQLMLEAGFYLPLTPNPCLTFNFAATPDDVENFTKELKKALSQIK